MFRFTWHMRFRPLTLALQINIFVFVSFSRKNVYRLIMDFDTLIVGALVFDGTGNPATVTDVAISEGKIAAIGKDLPRVKAAKVLDGSDQWLMPGLLDIHTHLDLEVDLEPGLPEVVRHGTTTVLVGNCSLGTCFGTQEEKSQEPIVDCFTRVENIPKKVLRKIAKVIDWKDTKGYLQHLDQIPLGPNIGIFVPHSMLRVEAMGLENSVSRSPTESEMIRMEHLLSDAMDQGYLGLSTDGLPFHYLSNSPNTEKRIPTQFASFSELKRLLKIVRIRDRVWQTTPIIENRLKAILYFTLTSGRLFGKTLKTSALSAMEMAVAPKTGRSFLKIAKLLNSWLFKGKLHFQALGTNFRVWSDGIVSPLFEELPSTCKLIAKEYDDVAGRKALLNDEKFIEEFRHDWYHGRRGRSLATLRTRLGLPDHLVIRDLNSLYFDGAPISEWDGESMQEVLDRLKNYKQTGSSARSDKEKGVFDRFSDNIIDEADFLLHLLREYDKDFRFWADVANVGNKATLDLLLDDAALPGFNDSGAHITNMAFFDANLMSLKLAQERDLQTVSTMVKRLTSEPANFFGIDVGTLDIGKQADIILIDPKVLKSWDCNETRRLEYRELFDHKQMVNRPEGIVTQVLINGHTVWVDGRFTDVLGAKPLGRALRAA